MNNFLVRLLQFILPRRFWYRRFYLWSKHWREIRKLKLAQHFYCTRCLRKPNMYSSKPRLILDVHHFTYRRIWHERLNDLAVLCRRCHKLEHWKG